MLAWRQLNDLEETVTYDVIIRDGLWFDGTGNAPLTRTLGIRDGVVATVAAGALDETGCPEVVDAAGKWVVPGFIDVHTHYDAEVLLDPGLRESVRHGVTTVLLGNCSLSTVYANSEDAADLFSRVEAVPREFVLGALRDNQTWSTPAEYIEAIDALPLGPNVSSLLGHSDLRTAVLGLDRATDDTVRPTEAELAKMAKLLDEALEAGMLGMSGMDAAIDKLDGDRFRSRALPSTFATWRERRKLISVLRHRGRILQSAPDVDNPVSALLFFLASSRIFNRRKGVRMSMLVSADAKSMPLAVHVFGLGTRVLNKLLGSQVRFHAEPSVHMGFSDAGAHLRNMAFYNFGLRLLKRARDADRAGQPFLSIERAVYRLTGELAEWFGIGAGTLRQGDRADFAVIDPTHLDESVDGYHEEAVPYYGGLRRMVNRNDATVVATGVGGTVVFRGGQFGGQFRDGYGQNVKSGRYLRAGELGAALSRSA